MRIVVELPDAAHLQLLAEVLAAGAEVRRRALQAAAADLIAEGGDRRTDAVRLTRHLAEAAWLDQLAVDLPRLAVTSDDADHPLRRAGDVAIGASPVYPSTPHDDPSPPPARRPAVSIDEETRDAALRALTVAPNARLNPAGGPVAFVDAPAAPPLLQAATAAAEAAAGTATGVYEEPDS